MHKFGEARETGGRVYLVRLVCLVFRVGLSRLSGLFGLSGWAMKRTKPA
jgi:hypothetical protein